VYKQFARFCLQQRDEGAGANVMLVLFTLSGRQLTLVALVRKEVHSSLKDGVSPELGDLLCDLRSKAATQRIDDSHQVVGSVVLDYSSSLRDVWQSHHTSSSHETDLSDA
jgi:hypothetical protein